ncbi:DUF1707 domain-containing protein [Blastococcus sp. TF02A-26]|uniref:DUF1707 SHOCT-like domain-containing protein n=1 Tax=Blastococcus sp. TF02A-26 TaxID=2250577 RepID=UPI000DE90CED|nr:DUF1707 domain-containing protein [Blastococcus sp. TF02A-26]RBY88679.1 DUF1707 domain-containing protein [Blastococcus sp. TF02A-26]
MPEPHLRAADADRTAVAGLLGEHMAAGRLEVAEYEDRVARAYAARTYGELDALTTDLPPLPAGPSGAAPVPVPPAGATAAPERRLPDGQGRSGWGGTRAGEWASWLTTGAIVLTIWLATSLASGEWLYPWPIWVIGPWGAILLAQTLAGGRGGPDERPQLPS